MAKPKKIINQQAALSAALVLATCAFALMPDIAWAGTGGKEFGGIWTTAKDWNTRGSWSSHHRSIYACPA